MGNRRSQADLEIERLRHKLVHMSIKARAMVSASVQALLERNSALAQVLISADRDVDRLELAIDRLCMDIIARRQPVAKDLRTVVLCTKMVTDLERIADLGAHISEEALVLNGEPPVEIDPALAALCDYVERRVQAAMYAFAQSDATGALRVIEGDVETHAQAASILKRLVAAAMAAPAQLGTARRLHAVTTHLERVGDHATNLAEMVVFMVEGRDVRGAVR